MIGCGTFATSRPALDVGCHALISRRKSRLTKQERSCILALAKQEPPEHLWERADETTVSRDEEGSAQWSLNALAQVAQEAGIGIKRSQIRRIYLRDGVRLR